MSWMHRNALRDTQIPPDGKTKVRRKVPQHAFCEIHTGPTPAIKIVRQHFVGATHQNALRDPQIPPDAKTQVQRNMS
jgi:hypothetical protein